MTNLILFVIFIAHIYSQIYKASFDIFLLIRFAGGRPLRPPLATPVNWVATADGCVYTADTTQLDFAVGKFVPTRRDCRQLVTSPARNIDRARAKYCNQFVHNVHNVLNLCEFALTITSRR